MVEMPEKIGTAFLANPVYATLEPAEVKEAEYLRQALQDDFVKSDMENFIGQGEMLKVSFGINDVFNDGTPDNMIELLDQSGRTKVYWADTLELTPGIDLRYIVAGDGKTYKIKDWSYRYYPECTREFYDVDNARVRHFIGRKVKFDDTWTGVLSEGYLDFSGSKYRFLPHDLVIVIDMDFFYEDGIPETFFQYNAREKEYPYTIGMDFNFKDVSRPDIFKCALPIHGDITLDENGNLGRSFLNPDESSQKFLKDMFPFILEYFKKILKNPPTV